MTSETTCSGCSPKGAGAGGAGTQGLSLLRALKGAAQWQTTCSLLQSRSEQLEQVRRKEP